MDGLHTVLRTIKSETKGEIRNGAAAPRDGHLDVFREFLRHLDRAHKRNAAAARGARRKPRRKR